MRSVALALALLALGGDARADDTTQVGLGDEVTLDWTGGALRAVGVGLADRRAPSPAVARAASRRRAEEAARAALAAALPRVPWRAGAAPAWTEAERAALAARALPAVAELSPDGSWRVELALPLERVRVAVDGARVVEATTDDAGAPTAIVVDARHLTLTPVLGLTVRAGGVTWRGPTLWVTEEPVLAVVGATPVALRASAMTVDALELEGALPPNAASSLLVVRIAGGAP